jgi:hypothetical protein
MATGVVVEVDEHIKTFFHAFIYFKKNAKVVGLALIFYEVILILTIQLWGILGFV